MAAHQFVDPPVDPPGVPAASTDLEPAVDPTIEDIIEIFRVALLSLTPLEAARNELDELGLSDLQMCAVLSFASAIRSAGRALQNATEQLLADELGPNNGIRYGDSYIKQTHDKSFKIWNREGLIAYLGDDAFDVINVSAPGAVPISKLRALARERIVADSDEPISDRDLKGRIQTVIDTFGSYQYSTHSTVRSMPIDAPHTPKYAKGLQHGQRNYPKGQSLEAAVEQMIEVSEGAGSTASS